MAEGRAGSRFGLKPLPYFVVACALEQETRGANARQLLLLSADAGIGCEFVEHLCASLRIAIADLRCEAESSQHAVAGWRLRSELRKRRFRLSVLALFGELHGLVEGVPGLRGLLRFKILIAAPATHRGDDQKRSGNDVDRILFPQLLELLPTDFLVDFIK